MRSTALLSAAAAPTSTAPGGYIRASFEYGSKQLTHWFPGHMAKGMREMQRRLNDCDCVLEVHDARLPYTGRNPAFDMLRGRPRLLVLNKADLANSASVKRAVRSLSKDGQPVIATVCGGAGGGSKGGGGGGAGGKQVGVRQILPKLLRLVDSRVFQREPPHMRILVAGMPNVGKSTVVNALRQAFTSRGKCAPTGDRPGVTRAVQNDILVSEDPPIYILDTPGVMLPRIDDQDLAMRLALIGTLRDEVVGEELLADYALWTLNRTGNLRYVNRYQLSAPNDDIEVVLPAIAKRVGALGAGGVPDTDRAARHFLRDLRKGKLGSLVLED